MGKVTTSAAPGSRESFPDDVVARPGAVLGALLCAALLLAVWPMVYMASIADGHTGGHHETQIVAATFECLSFVAGLAALAPRRRNDHA